MLDYAEEALGISEGKSRETLEGDTLVRYALLHLFCVLGEAANRVSSEGQSKYGDIPWKNIIGMRNKLIHGYDVVDLNILWETVATDLPALVSTLRESLPVSEE
jgi:uncharacterized protein with HEPN domain